jgi:CBS domain-containing protein
MNVREVMTDDPICCSPAGSIQEAASQMAKQNCGEIPMGLTK